MRCLMHRIRFLPKHRYLLPDLFRVSKYYEPSVRLNHPLAQCDMFCEQNDHFVYESTYINKQSQTYK